MKFAATLVVPLLLITGRSPVTAADFSEEDDVVIFEREQDVDPLCQTVTPFFGVIPPAPFQFDEIYRSTTSTPATPYVMVIVNTSIQTPIQTALDRYIEDLENSGLAVMAFQSSGGSHTDLKAEIADLYASLLGSGGLAGAVLIGQLPVPWFEMDDDFRGRAEFPIDLYYMDLDGDWDDSDNDGLLDQHSDGAGNQNPEIWVGRMTAAPLDGDEADLLNAYFEKNHEYRIGNLIGTGRGLSYVDDDWEFFEDAGLSLAYDDVTVVNEKDTTTAADYKLRLPQDFEWVHVMAHSWPRGHRFYVTGGSSDVMTYDELPMVAPQALFYNLFACTNARYVEDNYMGGWYIFAGSSNGLAALGSTKTGSMLSFSNFYIPFGQGESVGEAYKKWFDSRAPYGLSQRQWFYGMTLLGDPTLSRSARELQDRYWVSTFPDGVWSDPANWSLDEGGPGGAGQPQSGDRAFMIQSDAIDRTVHYASQIDPAISRLTIDATGTGTIQLRQFRDSLRAGLATIGLDGSGDMLLAGGTATFGNLILANAQASGGSFELRGGAQLRSSLAIVGVNGAADFTQAGGDFGGGTPIRQLILAFNASSTASYVITDGTLAASQEFVGLRGTGSFTQTGGVNSVVTIPPPVGGSSDGTLEIASETGSEGVYNLFGGTLSAESVVNNDRFNYFGGQLIGSVTNNANFGLQGAREIEGDYTQGDHGRLFIDVFGVSDFEQLSVLGYAHLAGSIEVGAFFDPPTGASFDILNANSIAGYDQDLFVLSSLSSTKAWCVALVDGGTTIRVAVIDGARGAGDLDCDGSTGSSDRTVLRSALGTSAGQAGHNADADYDNDGEISYNDYRIWYGLYRNGQ